MNKICIYALLFVTSMLSAQTVNYEQRYNLLVSKLGPAGIGVETVLDNWAKVDSTNIKLLTARFNYYYSKSQSEKVVKLPQQKYLGMKPLLSLKDSTGTDIYYFQETVFDDETYVQALEAADKAIEFYPDYLDFRFLKANAYIAYEKESPDMALAFLLDLVQVDASRTEPWKYEGKNADNAFFEDALQEYCYSFYSIGSPKAMEAFLRLSEKMNQLHPGNPEFLNNIGSYNIVVAKDYKTALKCYDKVLKKYPEDYTAIRNAMLAARKLKNKKLEKKYLQMIVKYGPEAESRQAKVHLEQMTK